MRQLSKDRLPNKRKNDLLHHATFLRYSACINTEPLENVSPSHPISLSYLHIFPKNVGGTLNLCRRILQCANVRKKCHKILLGLPNTALGILYILNARCFYE